MESIRAFFRDVASNALGKWSGVGGIMYTVAALIAPTLLAASPWPYLGLGCLCFFCATISAWRVAYKRTLSRFDVLPDHPHRLDEFWGNQGFESECHRVVIVNNGIEPIHDARVNLIRFGPQHRVIDIVPMATDGKTDVTLYNAVPRAFDLFVYDALKDAVLIHGRYEGQKITIPRGMLPRDFVMSFSVSGDGIATRHFAAVVINKNKRLIVGPPQPIVDPSVEIRLSALQPNQSRHLESPVALQPPDEPRR